MFRRYIRNRDHGRIDLLSSGSYSGRLPGKCGPIMNWLIEHSSIEERQPFTG